MTVLLDAYTKEHGEEAEWDRKRNWRELLHILNGRDEVWGTGGTAVNFNLLFSFYLYCSRIFFFNFQEIPIYFNV